MSAQDNIEKVLQNINLTNIGGYAFEFCSSLKNIYYTGTQEEWDKITKNNYWDYNTGNYTITYNYKGSGALRRGLSC